MNKKNEQLKALYREYRPDVFEDVIGQDATISALQRVLTNNKVAHAYLFSGPRGCGKTTCARIFARCLNCAEGPVSTPCGKCPSCIELRTGGPGSVDVIEMDAASHNGVDDARELRERVEYAPNRDRYKIVILDEAHMITANAFNALLKIVEEPPEHVKFIFATTEPEKLIGTIRSRTYHYPFRLVPSAVMVEYIKKISKKENIELDERIYPLLVKIGGGSVRDTLSFLDQLFASAVDDKVEYDFSLKLLGFTPIEYIHDALYALSQGDVKKLFSIAENLTNNGISTSNFLIELLENVRNSLLISISSHDVKPALGEVDEQQIKAQATLAGSCGFSTLANIVDILLAGANKMKGPTSGRLVLELTFAQLAPVFGNIGQIVHSPEQVNENKIKQSTVDLAQTKFEQHEKQHQELNFEPIAQNSVQTTSVKSETRFAKSEESKNQNASEHVAINKSHENINTSKISNEIVQEEWGKIIDALLNIKKPAAILIKGQGKFLKVDLNTLLIVFENPRFVETFERSQYATFVSQAVLKVLGTSMNVRAVTTSETSAIATEVKIEAIETEQVQEEITHPVEQVQEEITQPVEHVVVNNEADEIITETSDSTTDDPFSSLKEMLGATEVNNTPEDAKNV
ncbi:MAG: DNA polymerase III subunit gamma/tau [Candidatus Ancillula sp.]|jgi:DNA polymerase III subunit gamma/tau|nr:DNA polymerase III subunit gamma/tau [Candidatus Ancillula sp.]